jgi:hypothetical protein
VIRAIGMALAQALDAEREHLKNEIEKLRQEIKNSQYQVMINNYEVSRLKNELLERRSDNVVELPKFIPSSKRTRDAA